MTGERLGLENDFLLILLCFCFRFWDLVDMSDLHYRGLSLGYTDISFVYLKLCVCVCVCVCVCARARTRSSLISIQ